jgi:hypothetical protein
MEDDLKISKVEYLVNCLFNHTQILNFDLGNQSFQILQMKKTSYGRRPENIKSGISQQPLIGSNSNFKLKLRLPKKNLQILEMKTTFNGR